MRFPDLEFCGRAILDRCWCSGAGVTHPRWPTPRKGAPDSALRSRHRPAATPVRKTSWGAAKARRQCATIRRGLDGLTVTPEAPPEYFASEPALHRRVSVLKIPGRNLPECIVRNSA